MNFRQKLYFDQARSDFDLFRKLAKTEEKICHRLHYLQMAAEKLGKALLAEKAPLSRRTHATVVKFLAVLANKKQAWKVFHFANRETFETFIESIKPVAAKIEKLAPDLADDGPNPEYPWPDPPKEPKFAPVDFDFPLWKELTTTTRGRKFVNFLEKVFVLFPLFF